MDSFDLRYYEDHLGGVAKRQKFRIRWYGSFEAHQIHAVLERKLRVGQVSCKQRLVLDDLGTHDVTSIQAIRATLARAWLRPDLRTQLASLHPVLLNRYYRQYYESLDGRLRLTVDRDQRFSPVPFCSSHQVPHWLRDDEVVLELKYAVGEEPLAVRATQSFPFRLARHSKYVHGIGLIDLEPR